jgi:hypothetical protein
MKPLFALILHGFPKVILTVILTPVLTSVRALFRVAVATA